MNFLFTDEILDTLKEIEKNGGYKNNDQVMMPKKRFLNVFDNYEDLRRHIHTIIQSLFQIFHSPLPCVCLAIGSLFKFVGSLLLLDLNKAKAHGLQSLTYLWYSTVISGFLSINIGLHAISLVTRSLSTGLDTIGKQYFTPSTN